MFILEKIKEEIDDPGFGRIIDRAQKRLKQIEAERMDDQTKWGRWKRFKRRFRFELHEIYLDTFIRGE